jgi:glutamate formiminotransferase / 5-formyltetrahydrofolate cyclo-ligase
MSQILLCEPNLSEGRDLAIVEQIVAPVRATPGVKIIDLDSDADHNRTVLTFLGAPEAVLAAANAMADVAIELIDMSTHTGSHPRLGAIDVAAFVPIRNISADEAVAIAKQFGEHLGSLGVPVYYYEDAATRPERKSLPKIRKGQYEALPEKMLSPDFAPDAGPATFNAKSGATVTGSRFSLLAYNVNLATTDLDLATTIARSIRQSGGGFPAVRAIGLVLEEKQQVQVSMNLVDYRITAISTVFEAIRAQAEQAGVAVVDAELVGPVPLAAFEDALKHYLQLDTFDMHQIVENAILDQ